ncbi:MAG: F0F1 ATP synthase subunit A [Nocardioidaceae bacterium]
MSATTVVVASADIQVGNHITVSFLGLTLNADTIWATAIAGAVVLGLGLFVRSKVSSGVPGKVQLVWETLVETVTTSVEGNLGRVNPFVVPLAIALFIFILTANWLELIPSGEDPKYLPAPTSDVNLTYALALLVIVGVHVHSIRERGLKGYVKHYFEPYPVLFPLTLLEEIVKPFTLALRLFGNIFAGGVMIALIGLLPIWSFWGPNILWKLFDMGIGLIQAFIFALLTILYFGMAGDSHAEHGQAAAAGADVPRSDEPELQPAH